VRNALTTLSATTQAGAPTAPPSAVSLAASAPAAAGHEEDVGLQLVTEKRGEYLLNVAAYLCDDVNAGRLDRPPQRVTDGPADQDVRATAGKLGCSALRIMGLQGYLAAGQFGILGDLDEQKLPCLVKNGADPALPEWKCNLHLARIRFKSRANTARIVSGSGEH
jgi:hypothetical protein